MLRTIAPLFPVNPVPAIFHTVVPFLADEKIDP
jgi:hypothetical protein